MRATRALIHINHFIHNLQLVRSQCPQQAICVAVKADAYGHGAIPLSQAALQNGATHLAVATLEEAAQLREAGLSAPILLFSLLTPEEIPEAVSLHLQPFETSARGLELYAQASAAQGRRTGIHLKVDTGMGRIGCPPEQVAELALFIHQSPHLELAGLATHFPSADEEDPHYTQEQVGRFQMALQSCASFAPQQIHAANSGAIVAHPQARFTMVRPGIMLYGYYPSHDQKRHLDLKPVMELRSKLVHIKRIKKGDTVSYGRSWTAPHETVIGTIPAGYADGYNRLLSNQGWVAVNGRQCPVVGRVCMDQFMVDLGPQAQDELYDDVVLFGGDAPAPSAEDIADLCQSISYEVTCRIDKRVPRVYEGL
ncbi:MAG: alanine racemase [Spirochaetales bacterium]|nr:alanine racemase [Spirochaetales bacterium]